jgi:hypothetical protein
MGPCGRTPSRAEHVAEGKARPLPGRRPSQGNAAGGPVGARLQLVAPGGRSAAEHLCDTTHCGSPSASSVQASGLEVPRPACSMRLRPS